MKVPQLSLSRVHKCLKALHMKIFSQGTCLQRTSTAGFAQPCSHQVRGPTESQIGTAEGWNCIDSSLSTGSVQVFRSRRPLKVVAARVGGVEIPNNKHVEFSVRYIYGIGPTTAKAVVSETVSPLPNITWAWRYTEGICDGAALALVIRRAGWQQV